MQSDYMYKEFITSFIQKVFNYYNGRINKCNYPAMLNIEWANYAGSDIGANTKNPNILDIYPNVIAKYSSDYNYFYFCIIETIIHELYHMDQIIDYRRYSIDPSYTQFIEYAVETQTHIYIACNKKDIYEQFGINISSVDIDRLLREYDQGYTYFRRRYDDHICILLNDICSLAINTDSMNQIIKYNINNSIGKIYININDNVVKIQDGSYLMPIDEVNSFFYNYYFITDYKDRVDVYTLYEDNILMVNIITKGAYNIMVKSKEDI